jgi:hypothetical protein
LISPANASATGEEFKIDSETSVSGLKAHFFETLSALGEMVEFSRSDTAPGANSAVELGYLVTHDPTTCILPEPNDTLPWNY